jgi:16S rRNA (adenine1518-N6/adenine1519-N6)-dimethyltransferase
MRPKRSLGQNFLSDPGILNKIVKVAGVGADAAVLEIGAGLGSLTRYLAASAAQVVAIEIDKEMLGPLGETLAPFENVRTVHGDILEHDPRVLMNDAPYSVVANIPYYITSAIMRHLLESGHPPRRLTLTMQKEVAERVCSTAPKASLLSLSVQVYGEPRIVAKIPAGAFYPPPKVDSAVIRVDLYDQPLIPVEGLDDFFRLIKAGFSQKRKTLRNSVSAGLRWDKERIGALFANADIDPQRRAQTLSIEEWGRLVAWYQKM